MDWNSRGLAWLFLHVIFRSCFGLTSIDAILDNTIKRIPTQNVTRPLNVRLGFYLEHIGNFKSAEMSFDVDMYAYMSWRDHRLRHKKADPVLVNDHDIRKKLWLPDLYFANAKEAKVHEVTSPNFNMFIERDGTIAYSCRFTMSISCNLKLQNYPMDVQMCGIRILSYAYIAKQMNVEWFDAAPIRANPDIQLPEFEITNITAKYCKGDYRYAVTNEGFKYDNFSCLVGKIYLSRNMGYNLIQSYIPTGLIVVISWVSFWIDRRAVPARVTLSFTTLVSLTTLGNGLRYGLPMVDYAKAIDLWYGACMIFVFLALLEFAMVNSIMRKSAKYEQMAKNMAASKEPEKSEQDGNWNRRTMRNFVKRKSIAPPNGSPAKGEKRSKSITPKSPDASRKRYDSSELDELREDELEISDDDAKMWTKAVQRESPNHLTGLLVEPKEKDEQSKDAQNAHAVNRSVAEQAYATMSATFSRRAFHLDQTCRYLFPGTFLIFALVYWIYFLYHQKYAAMEEQLRD
ncbi:unnamed protein product, partial [Mesorhabditis spiculigera]